MTSGTTRFVVGTGPAAVLNTANDAASGSVLTSALCNNLYAADFSAAKTGYAVGRTSAGTAVTVLKTTDAGASWTAVW